MKKLKKKKISKHKEEEVNENGKQRKSTQN